MNPQRTIMGQRQRSMTFGLAACLLFSVLSLQGGCTLATSGFDCDDLSITVSDRQRGSCLSFSNPCKIFHLDESHLTWERGDNFYVIPSTVKSTLPADQEVLSKILHFVKDTSSGFVTWSWCVPRNTPGQTITGRYQYVFGERQGAANFTVIIGGGNTIANANAESINKSFADAESVTKRLAHSDAKSSVANRLGQPDIGRTKQNRSVERIGRGRHPAL